jgi:hypothetical protein
MKKEIATGENSSEIRMFLCADQEFLVFTKGSG